MHSVRHRESNCTLSECVCVCVYRCILLYFLWSRECHKLRCTNKRFLLPACLRVVSMSSFLRMSVSVCKQIVSAHFYLLILDEGINAHSKAVAGTSAVRSIVLDFYFDLTWCESN